MHELISLPFFRFLFPFLLLSLLSFFDLRMVLVLFSTVDCDFKNFSISFLIPLSMLLPPRSIEVREELEASAVLNALAPSAPMLLYTRLIEVREELEASAVLNALAPSAPMLLSHEVN